MTRAHPPTAAALAVLALAAASAPLVVADDVLVGPLGLRATPIEMQVEGGYLHTCVLLRSGDVDCYGDNYRGRSEDYRGGDALDVGAGFWHSCALLVGGNVRCWGASPGNYEGGDAVAFSSGGWAACALRTGGNVSCWGSGWYGTTDPYLGGDAAGVAFGETFSCILLARGDVQCRGPPWEPAAADYAGGDAVALEAGSYHVCAVLRSGNVHCWGDNPFGQANPYLGGDALAVSAGGVHTCVLVRGGNVVCYGSSEYGLDSDYGLGDARAVGTGGWQTCVVRESREVSCWGNGQGGMSPYVVPPDVDGYAPLPAGWERSTLGYARVAADVEEQARVRGAPRPGGAPFYDVTILAGSESTTASVYTAGLPLPALDVAIPPVRRVAATLDLDHDPDVCLVELDGACLAAAPDPASLAAAGPKAAAYLRIEGWDAQGARVLDRLVAAPVTLGG